ncbi:MAG: amidohydrolase family protein [Planctomycetota bacterium]
MSTLTHKFLTLGITLLLFFQQGVAEAQSSPKVALTGGKILTVSGAPVVDGTILIENGIIQAVGGADMEVPYDAMEVDCSGMILAPGLVDAHNPAGLDIPNENLSVAPFVDVYDAIDPSRFFFENSLRNGISTVHVMQGNNCVVGGVSRIVHPIGLSPDEMTRLPGIALKMSVTPKGGYDRLRQRAELRGVFSEFDRWHENLAETRYEQEAENSDDLNPLPPAEAREKGKSMIREEDLDDRHRNLAYLDGGKLGAWIHCGAATDVAPAIAMIADRGWTGRAVLVLSGDAHLAAAEIAEAKVPVVLDSDLIHRERDAITGEVEETFIPEVMRQNRIRFALQAGRSNVIPENLLTYQAARLVRNGMSQEQALRTITLGAAEICGVADQYGSIDKGKVANIVMWTGNPLEMTSWVQKVWIEGILAYDREMDARLQRLFPEVEEEESSGETKEMEGTSDGASGEEAQGEEGSTEEGAGAEGSEETPEDAEPLKKDGKSEEKPAPSPEPGTDSASKGGL